MKYDEKTMEWFKNHVGAQTTVCKCEKCELLYKPSLGHRCKRETERNRTIEEMKNKICLHFTGWQYSEIDRNTRDIIELAIKGVEEIAEQMKRSEI